MPDHTAPEQRTIDVDVRDLDTRGRTVVGYAAVYGAESGDLGGFRERIAPGAFASVLDADVRCLLNHDPNVVLGRTKSGTMRLADDQRGLRFEVDLPESRSDLREAVGRGDLDGASFRFKVGAEEWDGDLRTVKTVEALHDVTLATYPAYPAASVELRTRPEAETTTAAERQENNNMETENRNEAPEGAEERTETEERAEARSEEENGGLQVEDRTAEAPSVETRVIEAIRSVNKGESRDLTTATASAVAPPELGTFLWDRLRPASIALAAGAPIIPTDRERVTWPQLVSDVSGGPDWVAELEQLPEGPPGFDSLEAVPKKLAHLISNISNEVIDDSDPSLVDVLNAHLIAVLALKFDLGYFEGNPAANADSVRGLKFVSGTQEVSMGTNGAAVTNYDPIIEAVGTLRGADVPGPYAIAMHPDVLTEFELLKAATDSNEQLTPPRDLPPIRTSSQLSTTETQGTATDARSIYVYAPAQVPVVRRRDASIELDRSRLFNIDASEMRGIGRADVLAPNPEAICRVTGVIPAV